MSSDCSFKKHRLGTSERLWLEEAAQQGFFPRRGLENLRGRIPDDFRPTSIDSRLYSGDRILPIGLWHVDPDHPDLRVLDQVIRAIKARIPVDNVGVAFTSAEIAAAIGVEKPAVARAFRQLMDFGAGFFDQAHGLASSGGEGFDCIQFSKGNLFDYYRKYGGIEDLLERAYTRPGRDFWAKPSAAATASAVRRKSRAVSSASARNDHTRFERVIERLQNHPILSLVIVAGAIVIAVGSFTEALVTIKDSVKSLFEHDPPATSAPAVQTRRSTTNPPQSAVKPGVAILTASFDDPLDSSDPPRIGPIVQPFVSSQRWALSHIAHSGANSVNVTPHGNPIADLTKELSSGEILFLEVARFALVRLEFWYYSTSNPRPRAAHNCDGSLDIYWSRENSQDWRHYTAICGNYKSEAQGWSKAVASINTTGATRLSFRFSYTIQNAGTADPTTVFLLDDLQVVGYYSSSDAPR